MQRLLGTLELRVVNRSFEPGRKPVFPEERVLSCLLIEDSVLSLLTWNNRLHSGQARGPKQLFLSLLGTVTS